MRRSRHGRKSLTSEKTGLSTWIGVGFAVKAGSGAGKGAAGVVGGHGARVGERVQELPWGDHSRLPDGLSRP